MTTLMQCNEQWMKRPADERFLSLTDLHKATQRQREASVSSVVSTRRMQVIPSPGNELRGLAIEHDNGVISAPTNWAFDQLAYLAAAPAGYMRKLPAPLAADAMNYGLRFLRDVSEVGILRTESNFDQIGGDEIYLNELRAATGPNYGRIWNSDIIGSLVDKFGDGRTGDFRVPGEFGSAVPITKQNTTIYGSDRDVFVFLADEENRIEMKDRRDGKPGSLARGFFVWNSEVGSQTVGAAFFLFDYVCRNRIVWGAREFKEMRLRHTKSAPDRWLEEITPVLMEYGNASAAPIEQTIREAQQKRVDDDLQKFLSSRFTKPEVAGIMAAHEREECRPIETLWDATTAVTAYAKTFEYQDARVDLERRGGALLDLVAA